jgi:glycosyltransferase involved in cell wall biosynthesis
MKVLHVVPSFGFGGMERIICAIINGTSKCYTHEVLVIYNECEAKKWIKQECTRIHCLNRSKGQFDFIKSLYKRIKEIRPDVLMTYNWGATDAIWIGRLLKIKKIIHSEHGFNIDEAASTSFQRNIARAVLYRMTDEIVVVSRDLKKLMIKKLLMNEQYIHLISNGIDSNITINENYDREIFRKHLGYKNVHHVVGFSGRLDPIKNFAFMLEIFSECVREDRNFRLLIIGDGQEKEKIKKICVEKCLEEYVSLIGKQESVAQYLGALDMFLLTSVREQMPMTVLEAMSLALPVVASNVGEMSRLITHGQDGMIFDLSETPATFAKALLRLRDTSQRQAMGVAARQKVVTQFQAETMVEKYRQVIARGRLV